MSKQQFAKDWISKVDDNMKAKEKIVDMTKWEEYKDMYRNEFLEEEMPNLNIIYSSVKTILPRTYFRTPTVTVTPRRPEFALHARVVEAVDNWILREIKIKAQFKRSIIDTFLCGTGIMKVGYDSEYGFLPDLALGQDTGSFSQTSYKTADKIEYRPYIKSGMPWSLRCSPTAIITPFGYGDPDSLPWVADIIFRPLEDVKNDIKYNNNRNLLKGSFVPSMKLKKVAPEKVQTPLTNEKNLPPFVELYEIRDFSTGRIYVLAEDMVLLDEEDAVQIECLPYDFLIFNEDPDFLWGIPDAKYITPHQIELNQIKIMTNKLRKFNIIKFLYKKGVLDNDTLELLLSDSVKDIGAGIPVSDETLQSAILPLQPHNLTKDLEQDKQMILSDHRETMGFSRNTQGEYIPLTSKTATEAQIVQQGAEIRVDERRDVIADTLVSIVSKINQLIFKYWTTERVAEITGVEGQRQWIKYTGEQLKGEYFLSIDPDTGVPITKRLRQEQAVKLLEMFRNDPQVDQIALKKLVLSQFEWIYPAAALLTQEPTGGMDMGQIPGLTPGGAQGGMGQGQGQGPGGVIPFDQMLAQARMNMKGGR